MDIRKIAAILLIVGGALALAFGGLSYTSTTQKAEIGPLHLNVSEEHRINIPVWAGIAAIVGGVLLLTGLGRR